MIERAAARSNFGQTVRQDVTVPGIVEAKLLEALGNFRLQFDDIFGFGIAHGPSRRLDSSCYGMVRESADSITIFCYTEAGSIMIVL